MTKQSIPIIAASNIDTHYLGEEGRNNLVAGEITCEADAEHGIEPGIGQRITLFGSERELSWTGVVVDRWKARDEDTGALSVEVVIETA